MFNAKRSLTVNLSVVFVVCLVFLVFGCRGKSNAALIPTKDKAAVKPTPATTPPVKPEKSSKIKFSSVYTKIDEKNCKPLFKSESDEDEVPYLCDGYKDYKIYISMHGISNFYIGREISKDKDSQDTSGLPVFLFNAGFDQTIEWRLADGEPFSCIVRQIYNKQIINPDETGDANELVIKNLKGFAPIDIKIDAKKSAKANEEARRQADSAYRKM